MTTKRATIIFNPNAGAWDWDTVVDKFSLFWQQRGWQIQIRPTEYAGHATELARVAATGGGEMVLAVGGDGTLNEVANGLANSETIMAPVPIGTANSFARELGIPMPSRTRQNWFVDALNALAEGVVRQMDLGLCDSGRYWLLWASMGVDGWIIERIEPRSQRFKRFGKLGYALKSALLMPRFHGVSGTVTVDDRTVAGDFMMVNVSNCRLYGGGLQLNRDAVLDDGLFEVWIFEGRTWYSLPRYVTELALGEHHRDPNVSVLNGRYVSVQTERPSPFHLDGEPAGETPFSCEIQRGALRLLTPKGTKEGLFMRPGTRLLE